MKDLSSSRGFSLLELLIYMAILSIMSVILSASFLSLTKGRAKSESRTEVNSNLRFAMERIVQDINAASAVSAPDRKSTRLNSSHSDRSRMPSSA